MASHIFPFYKISDEIVRPWVPIQMVNPVNNKKIAVFALLDTGADHCVFPKLVAEQLGLDLKINHCGRETMQGLSGSKIDIWKHNFKIELLSADRSKVIWRGSENKIACVEHDNIPPILGFINFMCHFKVVFNHSTKKILLDDHPKI